MTFPSFGVAVVEDSWGWDAQNHQPGLFRRKEKY
jgi:hypothetical protein